MGYIHETNSSMLGYEERRDSIILTNLDETEQHIFAYSDGCIEITKEYLVHLYNFIAENKDTLKKGK